jgi:hypothetical protein
MPVRVSDGGARSVLLGREDDGTLWLAAVVDDRLVLRHGSSDGRSWTTLESPPGSAATLPANQASLVGIDGGVALAWTSPDRPAVFVSRHRSGAAPTDWRETVLEGEGIGGQAGNLAALAVPGETGDRLVLTAGVDSGDGNPEGPNIVVIVVEPDDSWHPHLFGRVSDRHARPTLVADQARDRLFVVATASGDQGSGIYIKESPLGAIDFATGVGLPLIEGVGLEDVDDATVTKQPVSAATGIVTLASDDVSGRYRSAILPIGDAAIPGAGWAPSTDPQPLVRDTFDAWQARTPVTLDWQVSRGTPAGRLTLVDSPGGQGTALRLTSADGQRARGCRVLPITDGRPVDVDTMVWVSDLGGSDAAIAVRGMGEDTAVIRFDNEGTLAYFEGAEKVRTTTAFGPGTWYRVRLHVDPATKTYDLTVQPREGGEPLLARRGVAWRSPIAPAGTDEVCFEVPSGAGLALDVEQLSVRG